MLSDGRIEYRRLRAPRDDGHVLIDPAWPTIPELLAENLRRFDEQSIELSGRRLADLASDARREAIAAALRYSRSYFDPQVPPNFGSLPIIASGHQPELFHPGVWLKNFALDRIARQQNAIALNLVIDTDEVSVTSLRIPTGRVESPEVATVAFDDGGSGLPFELTPIRERELFESFGMRAQAALRPLVPDSPLIERLWPLAIDRAAQGANLGQALAQARHQLEMDAGLQTLELPQSLACQLASYRWLMAHILIDLPKYHAVHNEVLQEYRQVHRIRNLAHPVPALRVIDAWHETPFWIYRDIAPLRRSLLARQSGNQLLLADGAGWEAVIKTQGPSDLATIVEQFAALESAGVRIRTRALTTTMFARLLLCDLFIHGIGGAKYDQITDAIIQRFLSIDAPRYLTVTGTFKLPIPRKLVNVQGERELTRQLREIQYHPEVVIREKFPETIDRQIAAQMAQKEAWIRNSYDHPLPRQGAKRHAALEEINQALAKHIGHHRQALKLAREQQKRLARNEAILGSREYSFSLFPDATPHRLSLALSEIKA